MKFRTKIVEIEASQWFQNGDHPCDESKEMISVINNDIFLSEGKVVRRYRHPGVIGDTKCKHCNLTMHVHGWIDTLEGGHIVCPGDWIITGLLGERYPCKPKAFEAKYEPVIGET